MIPLGNLPAAVPAHFTTAARATCADGLELQTAFTGYVAGNIYAGVSVTSGPVLPPLPPPVAGSGAGSVGGSSGSGSPADFDFPLGEVTK